MAAPPCTVIDANHRGWGRRRQSLPADDAEQGVVADGKHQPLGKTRRRASAKRKRQMVDDMLEASGTGRQHLAKPLSKYLSAAENGVASEPLCLYEQPDASPREGKVRDLAAIATSNRSRHSSECWTRRGCAGSVRQDAGLIVNVGDAFGDEASSYQIRGAKPGPSKGESIEVALECAK